MGWSIKLGRIFGIDIKMHLTFLLIIVWGAFAYGGNAGPLYGVVVTLLLFALVLLHELGHSLAALGYGIPVKDIILLPIGGVARLERMPEKPLQELVVALAGPLVNVILAIGLLPFIILGNLSQGSSFSLQGMTQPGWEGLLTFLLMANISLAIFNMIPAFPLDGGRVLRALLGLFTNQEQATKTAVQVGRVIAVGLGLVGVGTGQFWLALIAIFIFFTGGQEAQAVVIRRLLRRVQAGQVVSSRRMALSAHATVEQIAPVVMANGYHSNFAILDPSDGRLLGVATSGRIARALAQGERYRGITEIMQHARHIPIVSLHTTLDEVQAKLETTSHRVAAVYDGLNFRGLITAEDIQRTFQFLLRHGYAPGSA